MENDGKDAQGTVLFASPLYMGRDRRKPFTYEINLNFPRNITEGDASYNTIRYILVL